MVPFSLGSDTNGSIRVPASFCGIFGLKPTFGRLSRAGTLGFVQSLDHLGPFARSARDLALVFDALQGQDEADPAQARRATTLCLPVIDQGLEGLRCAVLAGWFKRAASEAVSAAVDRVATALQARTDLTLDEAERGRAAAYCITAAEGANLHLADLKTRAADFDAATRDRFLAGALLPATVVQQAQRFRRWFHEQAMRLFAEVDILIAPATPITAPLIGSKTMVLDGREVPTRPNIGIYTQPISFIGLPVVAVPVHQPGQMPAGVQIIAAPWREDLALRVAAWLEASGIAVAPVAGRTS
jgi:aspartyl-tRNA(Asn)/glutamyl-tRNA(Gln) amidotransferase subunit A